MLAPCLSQSEEGCATRPPPHAGSGKAGRGVSLPFIPASREVTCSWGQARRGHGKEVGGGSHCLLECVILLGVWLSSPSAAEHQPQPWVGRQGTGITAISLGTPQPLGQQQPELLNLKLL